jgi:hypothetical protein
MTVSEPRLRNRPLSVTRDRRGGARSSRHSFVRAIHTWSTSLVPDCLWTRFTRSGAPQQVVGLSRRGHTIKRTSRLLHLSALRSVDSDMHTGHGAGYASYILEPCTHPHVLRVDAGRRRRRVWTEALSRLSLLFCRSTAVAEPPTQGDRVRCDSKVARAGDGAQAGPRASPQIERRPG